MLIRMLLVRITIQMIYRLIKIMSLLALLMWWFLSWWLMVYWNQPLDTNLVAQVSTPAIQHLWFDSSDRRQAIVQYAYQVWGLDFVVMIECENWQRNKDAVSRTKDYWICQLNYRYNSEFINSDKFNNVYSQLDYCYEKRKINPKLWYWPDRLIKWVKCSKYVLDRFIVKWWEGW